MAEGRKGAKVRGRYLKKALALNPRNRELKRTVEDVIAAKRRYFRANQAGKRAMIRELSETAMAYKVTCPPTRVGQGGRHAPPFDSGNISSKILGSTVQTLTTIPCGQDNTGNNQETTGNVHPLDRLIKNE